MKKRKTLITIENIHQIAGRIRKNLTKNAVYTIDHERFTDGRKITLNTAYAIDYNKFIDKKEIDFSEVYDVDYYVISEGRWNIFIIPGDKIYLDSNKIIITNKYDDTIQLDIIRKFNIAKSVKYDYITISELARKLLVEK